MKETILKESFKSSAKGKVGPYAEVFCEALGKSGFGLLELDVLDADNGSFVAYGDRFGIAEHLAVGSLLGEAGWTNKQVKLTFDNDQELAGALFVPPIEVTHREATPVEAAGGVEHGPVVDLFRNVIGDIDGEVYEVDGEQVWFTSRISRDQRDRLKIEGWKPVLNTGEDVVMGFERWSLPDHLLPPRGRRTARPKPVNLGTVKEQFTRVLEEPLPVWYLDGNSVFAKGDDVQRLDFMARNTTFNNQCSILRNAGWRESATTDFATGARTYRYFAPTADYKPANIWEALTLLQPRGSWFDAGTCVVSDGDRSVTWYKRTDAKAFGVAKSLVSEAAKHPCFEVLQGTDEVTYRFRAGLGF